MELDSVSASQTKDFLACKRIWVNKKLLHEYPSKTPSLEKGSAIHGGLEAYLKSGAVAPEIIKLAEGVGLTPEDLAEFVAAIKPYYGEPGEGVTEHRAVMSTWEGGPDFVLVVDHAREVQHPEHGLIPQIDDLKTTSDFRYCKTPDELAHDVQMISYAKWALTLFEEQSMPLPNFVALRHVYVRTKGKRVSRESSTLVTAIHVEQQWQRVLGTVREMVETARTFTDVQSVEPNTDSCSMYGGCFYRSKCFGDVTVSELFKQEKKKMSAANGAGTGNVIPGNFPGTPLPRVSMKDRLAAKRGSAAGTVVQPGQKAAEPKVEVLDAGGPRHTPEALLGAAAPALVGTLVCDKVCRLSPTLICTLVPHTGMHESKDSQGGVMHWDAGTMALGPSPDWKPLDPAAVAPPHVLPPDAPSRMSTAEEVAAANAPKVKRTRKSAEPSAPSAPAAGAAPTSAAAPSAGPTPLFPTESKLFGAGAAAAPAALPSQAAPAAPSAPPARVSRLRQRAGATAAATGAPSAAPALPPGTVLLPAAAVHAAVAGTHPLDAVTPNEGPLTAPQTAFVAAVDAIAAAGPAGVGAPAAAVTRTCKLEELYIDCWPSRGAVDAPGLAADILGPAAILAAEGGGVPDYRIIDYKAKGFLAMAVRSLLDKVPRVLVVSSSAPGSDVLLEVLIPHARRVVQAMRG